MDVPPGILYLGMNAHHLLLPPAIAYGLCRAVQSSFDLQAPTWLLILLIVLSSPTVFTIGVLYQLYRDERDAAALGAMMPPRLPDKSIGGLETLRSAVASFKTGYIGDNMKDTLDTYGNTVNIRILFENRILTSEPECIKRILATQFDGFEKGNFFKGQMKSLLGTGVFNSDGETWKFHRNMTRPFFSKERISHYDNFDIHAEDTISQIKTRISEGYPIDFQDAISRFTLDSATEFLFGADVRSLSAGLPYPYDSPLAASYNHSHPANVFAHAFGEAQKISGLRGRYGPIWPLTEFWRDTVKPYRNIVNSFVDPILDSAIAKQRSMSGDKKDSTKEREVAEGETLLDHMVNFTEDPAILRDEVANILVAGRDTTAGTLTFAVYLLAEHPQVLKRLREEIASTVGTSRPTADDIRDMKYLRAVLNETLRLFPSVPRNIRTTTKPTLWPSKIGEKPYYIPANTRTPYSVLLMHRRKDLWGPDAELFDPDRWLDHRLHQYLTPNPFIFLPFNAGPRICLGQQFAYTEMSFFLIKFFQHFSTVSLAPEAQPPESRPPSSWANADGRKSFEKIVPKSHLTMYSMGGLWVHLKETSSMEAV